MNKKLHQNKEWLYQKYWIEGLSLRKIAKLYEVNAEAVRYYMEKFKIKRRSKSEASLGERNPMWGTSKKGYWLGKKMSEKAKRKMSESMSGEKHPMWGKHHSKEARKKMSKSHMGLQVGENHPNWKGGRYKSSDGYILIYNPKHPNATSQGYVFEHRLLLEKHLGRYLNLKERVHHINRKKDDNRNENFMLFPSMFSHRNYHKKLKEITTA